MATYCMADIHGCYDLWQKIMDFLKPKDVLYVIGDCGDRGKDGWKIIKEAYENPRVKYIKGNHEDMLAEAMCGDKSLCFFNGGKKTYKSWKYKDGAKLSWYKKLKDLPNELIYINKRGERVVMCHAGYTPSINGLVTEKDMLWDRYHFEDIWEEDYIDTIMVHGHTICPTLFHYLYEDFPSDYDFLDPKIIKYSGGHKIDLDLGSAFTGKICLLNLDTWEENYFYSEDLYSSYKDTIQTRYSGNGIGYW